MKGIGLTGMGRLPVPVAMTTRDLLVGGLRPRVGREIHSYPMSIPKDHWQELTLPLASGGNGLSPEAVYSIVSVGADEIRLAFAAQHPTSEATGGVFPLLIDGEIIIVTGRRDAGLRVWVYTPTPTGGALNGIVVLNPWTEEARV